MYVLGTVESSRTAGTDAVIPEGLDSLLLEGLVRIEVIEIVGAEVGNGTTVGKLRLGSDRPVN